MSGNHIHHLEADMPDEMSRERAEFLRDIMVRHQKAWDWSKYPEFHVAIPLGLWDSAAPSLLHIVYRRQELAWRTGTAQCKAYRIVAEGLIIEAAYLDGDKWVPLEEEIGKPV